MGRAMLILAGGMVIILGMVQVSLLNREEVTLNRSVTSYAEGQAKNIANSAADMAIAEVNSNYTWRSGFTNKSYMGGVVNVSLSQPKPYQLLVNSTATYHGRSSSVEVLLERDPFSRYSYFTDKEEMVTPYGTQPIYFVTHDTLTGPVHTNGTMRMQGRPVFNGKVSSPHMWEGPSGRNGASANPQFNDETNFGAEEVDFPVNVPDLVQMAVDGGLKYDDKIRLDFKNDGTVDISKEEYVPAQWICKNRNRWGCVNWDYQPGGYQWSVPQNHDLDSFNGVISSSKEVEVKGEVSGSVTVHSEDNVKIIGDIIYADDPTDSDGSDDMLGIVSDKDVVVDKDAHKDHGNRDIQIQASIMALGESFTVEDYDRVSRGQIYLYGGIIQKRRGPVGLVSGAGYTKSYTYDKRLLDFTTPGFPRKDLYSTVYWKE